MEKLKQRIKYLFLCVVWYYAYAENTTKKKSQRAVLIDEDEEETNSNCYRPLPTVEMAGTYKD